MMDPWRWLRLRWAACACAGAAAAALLVAPSAEPWLRALGAAAAAHAVYSACAQWRVGGAWRARRVDALGRRAVLVTGCDQGFGYEAARRLFATGVGRVFACVLNDRSAGAEEFRGLSSPRMRVIRCDVTDGKAIASAAEEVSQELQRSGCELWAVVNNAGVLCLGESEWMHIEDMQTALDVNALGQVRITQTFLPLLRKAHGRVVNVNSLASRIYGLFLTPYTVSKFASLAFTESLRQEIARFSVSVHSIEPWIVKNEMGKAFIPMLKKKLDEIPNEIKNIYNEDYSRKVQTFYEIVLSFFAMPETSVALVAEAIEDACLSDCPEDRYVPGNLSKLTDSFDMFVYLFQDVYIKYFIK